MYTNTYTYFLATNNKHPYYIIINDLQELDKENINIIMLLDREKI